MARRLILPAAAGTLGLVSAFHPTIGSALGRIQSDPVDNRLVNYQLEHVYLWLCSAPGHERLWDPPIFYPTENVAAYSDLLLSVAPPYAMLRLLGVAPDTASQLWMMAALAADYLVGYLVLRRVLGLNTPGAAAGAFLFAFAASQVDQLGHPQLLPHVFTLIALTALRWAFPGDGSAGYPAWLLVAALAVVAELYGGFYLGWFLLLAGLLGLPWVLALPEYRRPLRASLGSHGAAALGAVALGGLLLWPLLTHYLRAAAQCGRRSYHEVSLSLPYPHDWFYLGPDSWLYGWQTRVAPFQGFTLEQLHRQGIGLVTPLACVAGLILGWRRLAVRLVALTGASLVVVATVLPRDMLLGAAAAVLSICLVELGRQPRPIRRAALTGAASFAMAAALFGPAMLPGSLLSGLAVFGVATMLGARDPARVRVATLLAGASFALLTTYPDRTLVLVLAVAGPLAVTLASRCGRPRPSAGALALLSLAILAALTLFPGPIVAWQYVYRYVPGGDAIRAVARIGLVVLIPLALGLALLFDWLAPRRPALALTLALVCVLEQGKTTSSFDKAAWRAGVERVARQIDPGCVAFYSSPQPSRSPDPALWLHPQKYQVDAMWAGLIRGKPTINGYSGHTPPGWHPLESPFLLGPGDADRLRAGLVAWCRTHGLPLDRVQWIGGPPGGLAPPPLVRAVEGTGRQVSTGPRSEGTPFMEGDER